MRMAFFRNFSLILAPPLLLLAGCGGIVTAKSSNSVFAITPGSVSIDTNCTGCNATSAKGGPVHQFAATLTGGGAARVAWSVAGGDAASGAGSINASGQYTPPSYLTDDRVEVVVTASLVAEPSLRASAVVSVTPGFLQPLTPENAAVGANGSVTITGILAEAGGTNGIHFALASSAAGTAQDITARKLAEKALVSLRDGGWLTPGALLVVEEAKAAEFSAPDGFTELERRAYDDTEFTFLRAVAQP